MRSDALIRPVLMRDRDEPHRAATPLELLFDLCFVVAVAVLAAELHHALADGHAAEGVWRYAALFVPLWWAWMSHTWYATAFDNDDPVYRVLTLAQMLGVLALAATVPAAFDGRVGGFVVAYAATRAPLLVHWWRAAHGDAAHAMFARRYLAGTVLALAVWLGALALPGAWRWVALAVAMGVELATPPYAVRAAPGRVFHAGHVAERYGLFTIIVIGETVLAVTVGLRDAVDGGRAEPAVVLICSGALVTAFALWWLYFDVLGREALERHRRAAFVWGYGHAVLYASVAALGAGVQAQIELVDHGRPGAGVAAVVVPTALALLSLAWLQQAANLRGGSARTLVASAVVVVVVGTLLRGRPGAADVALAGVLVLGVVVETRRRVEAVAAVRGEADVSGS